MLVLQWIDVVIELQAGVALVLQHLLLGQTEVVAHLLHVDAKLQLQYELADAERFHTGYGRLVGSQQTDTEPLAQTGAELQTGSFDKLVFRMFEEDVDDAIVWRIMEGLTLSEQRVEETLIVVAHDLVAKWQVGLLGLQDDKASLSLAPGTSAHLRHHHKGVLIGAEVRIVEHRVGIEDAHDADLVEVQAQAAKVLGELRRTVP